MAIDPELVALKAKHAPRLDRQSFDDKVAELWPIASKLMLSDRNREAMWQAHVELGLSPAALCAGFAESLKSAYKR